MELINGKSRYRPIENISRSAGESVQRDPAREEKETWRMKFALMASQQALNDYGEASWHERLNIMTEFFEQTLPIVVEEMKRKLEEENS